MKINLSHPIFQESPYKAFANQHDVKERLWQDMYHKRYMWYGYEIPILAEYFNLVTKKNLHERTIRRWIKRTEVYTKAQHIIKKGVKEVSSEYFEPTVTEQELKDMLK